MQPGQKKHENDCATTPTLHELGPMNAQDDCNRKSACQRHNNMWTWLLINSTARSAPPLVWWFPIAVGSGVTLIPNDLHALHAAWSKARVDGSPSHRSLTLSCPVDTMKGVNSLTRYWKCFPLFDKVGAAPVSPISLSCMARKVTFSVDSALLPQNSK